MNILCCLQHAFSHSDLSLASIYMQYTCAWLTEKSHLTKLKPFRSTNKCFSHHLIYYHILNLTHISASKIDDYCLTDKQCELNEKHSYCRWKIPHVYGVCECPPNYKHISVEQLAWPTISNSTGNATLFRGNLSTTTITTRCAPSK